MSTQTDIKSVPFVFPVGATLSGIVHLGNVIVTRIRPGIWTNAKISMKIGPDANSLGPLLQGSDGAVYSVTTTAEHECFVSPDVGQVIGPWVQLISGTPAVGVVQASGSNVVVTCRPY